MVYLRKPASTDLNDVMHAYERSVAIHLLQFFSVFFCFFH